MLSHCLRRWPNIVSAMVERLVLAGCVIFLRQEVLCRTSGCSFAGGTVSKAVAQHQTNDQIVNMYFRVLLVN